MRHRSVARVVAVERNVAREGFSERFHRHIFALESEGVPETRMAVRVSPDWPADQRETVARTFLRRRLLDLAEAAGEGAMDEAETEELWRQLREGG